jgi:hypothetical protein
MESSHKPEMPEPMLAWRTEDQIREDLRKQLEEIHLRYLKKWVWPCR